MLRLLKVTGSSLSPQYLEGDFVVTVKIPLFLFPLRKGDVIAFQHPQYGRLIKQIESISPDRAQIFVTGTHPGSIDSRSFGPISPASLIGKVIWHVRRPAHTAQK